MLNCHDVPVHLTGVALKLCVNTAKTNWKRERERERARRSRARTVCVFASFVFQKMCIKCLLSPNYAHTYTHTDTHVLCMCMWAAQGPAAE